MTIIGQHSFCLFYFLDVVFPKESSLTRYVSTGEMLLFYHN